MKQDRTNARVRIEALESRTLLTVIAAQSAAKFIDSIGINTHFSASSGIYTNTSLPAMLNTIGIKHVRDNVSNSTGASRLSSLYSNYGIKSLNVADWTGTSVTDRANWLAQPWAEASEGLNEPDLNARSYKGLQDVNWSGNSLLATRQYQEDLYAAIKANSAAASKPLLSPAAGYTADVAGLGDIPFDDLSLHRYPGPGNDPSWMNLNGQDFVDLAAIRHTGTEPIWLTESGYNTANLGSGPADGVPQSVQTKYLPRILTESFLAGVDRTYLYELADEGADMTNTEFHYGLVNYQSDPSQPVTLKPAGDAIRRLIADLNHSAAGSFTPGSLDIDIDAGSSSTANLHTMLLQENDANHTYDLVMWQEVNSYNASTQTTISNTPLSVHLGFNSAISSASVYSLDSDSAVSVSGANPRSLTVSVPDAVTIVRLTPGTFTAGAAPVVTVAPTDAVATEGSTTDTGRFTFTRVGGNTAAPLTVQLGIAGDATNGTDYQTIANTITFPANATTVTADVIASGTYNDSAAEGDEHVVVSLQNNAAYSVGLQQSATVTIKDDESLSDLTITKVEAVPANPVAGQAVTFNVTVKNAGTAATTGNWHLVVQPTYDWNSRLYSYTNPTLAAGASTVVTVSGTWTSAAGDFMPTAQVDEDNGVKEANEHNNFYAQPLTVASSRRSDDFQSGSINAVPYAGWTTTGNWQIQTYGTNKVLANVDTTSAYASPITTALPTQYATKWSADFDYDWNWGGSPSTQIGDYSITVAQDFTDNQGNGYRILVHQGDGGNAANTNKVIQIYSLSAGVVGSTPLAQGGGYNQCGFRSVGLSAPRLKHIRVTYDQVAGKLSVYGDANGDGQLELFAVATTGLSQDRINRMTFNTNTTATCAPVFDNVRVDLDNPLDTRASDFSTVPVGSPPPDYAVSGNWQAATYNGNTVLEDLDTAAGARYVATGFGKTYDGAWQARMDYDWKWGGDVTGGWGYYSQTIYMDMLDANGNGYDLVIHQGNSNSAGNTNSELQLYRRVAWNTYTLIGSSSGYNVAGWGSRGLSAPDLKRIQINLDPSTKTFRVYADPTKSGQMSLMMQVTDPNTLLANPTQIVIGAEGFTNSERPTIDNVWIDEVHSRSN